MSFSKLNRSVFISSSKRPIYEKLKDDKQVSTFAQLFEFAAAVGISNGIREEFDDGYEIIKTNAFDKHDILFLLMRERHPDMSLDEQIRELEYIANAGIGKVEEQFYRNNKKLDPSAFLRQ
jgi:hypothetical protein